MRLTIAARALLAGLVAVLAACSGDKGTDPEPQPGDVTVIEAVGLAFTPDRVTIPVGRKVRWVYRSGPAHDVASETNLWPRAPLDASARTFEFTFNTPGTYRYRCTPHSTNFNVGTGQMNGVIVVQ